MRACVVHAHQYYSIGIDNRKALADGDGFQCSGCSASNDDYDDELSNESFLKKLCVLLCMPQNACYSEHLKLDASTVLSILIVKQRKSEKPTVNRNQTQG